MSWTVCYQKSILFIILNTLGNLFALCGLEEYIVLPYSSNLKKCLIAVSTHIINMKSNDLSTVFGEYCTGAEEPIICLYQLPYFTAKCKIHLEFQHFHQWWQCLIIKVKWMPSRQPGDKCCGQILAYLITDVW